MNGLVTIVSGAEHYNSPWSANRIDKSRDGRGTVMGAYSRHKAEIYHCGHIQCFCLGKHIENAVEHCDIRQNRTRACHDTAIGSHPIVGIAHIASSRGSYGVAAMTRSGAIGGYRSELVGAILRSGEDTVCNKVIIVVETVAMWWIARCVFWKISPKDAGTALGIAKGDVIEIHTHVEGSIHHAFSGIQTGYGFSGMNVIDTYQCTAYIVARHKTAGKVNTAHQSRPGKLHKLLIRCCDSTKPIYRGINVAVIGQLTRFYTIIQPHYGLTHGWRRGSRCTGVHPTLTDADACKRRHHFGSNNIAKKEYNAKQDTYVSVHFVCWVMNSKSTRCKAKKNEGDMKKLSDISR